MKNILSFLYRKENVVEQNYAWQRRINVLILVLVFLLSGRFYSLPAQSSPDRSQPPKLGPTPPLELAPVQTFSLSNGLPVVMMEKHGVPLLQINLMVRSGSAYESADQTGLASFTAAMLDEGAGRRDALQLADAVDFLGAKLAVGAGMHNIIISLFTPVPRVDSALALMADVTLRPTFPQKELDRLRTDRLTELMQWRDEPRSIASVEFNRTLFGTKHPYGRPSIGNVKSLNSLKVADLKKFYQTWFKANNATLVVVGDVDRDFIEQRLEAAFGSWTTGDVPEVKLPEIKQVKKTTIYLVDKPDAAQTEIWIGRVGVPRSTRDYFALQVMNTILGGSFTSRLNQNLREEHGYTYGAGSYFDFRPLPGPFLARSSVQTAVTDSAVHEFMKELNGILKPVSDQELERARNYLALTFPQNFETVSRIGRQLGEMVAYNLPGDYFNTYTQNVMAVTGEQVQNVARKYIDPASVAIILVGDASKIKSGVQGLNIGPMKTLSIEDVLGKAPELSSGS